mmetsp:Transcript_6925/g.22492  ORF Transcript_6925/g.22492 Transcript_6925/m.22492 type:complete len:305 (+) Transcript_6925:2476-3390(+)
MSLESVADFGLVEAEVVAGGSAEEVPQVLAEEASGVGRRPVDVGPGAVVFAAAMGSSIEVDDAGFPPEDGGGVAVEVALRRVSRDGLRGGGGVLVAAVGVVAVGVGLEAGRVGPGVDRSEARQEPSGKSPRVVSEEDEVARGGKAQGRRRHEVEAPDEDVVVPCRDALEAPPEGALLRRRVPPRHEVRLVLRRRAVPFRQVRVPAKGRAVVQETPDAALRRQVHVRLRPRDEAPTMAPRDGTLDRVARVQAHHLPLHLPRHPQVHAAERLRAVDRVTALCVLWPVTSTDRAKESKRKKITGGSK